MCGDVLSGLTVQVVRGVSVTCPFTSHFLAATALVA